jgi:hypothetical protein
MSARSDHGDTSLLSRRNTASHHEREEYLRHLAGFFDVLNPDSSYVRWPNDGEYRTARREVDGVRSVSYI